jgi:hypothetical protein
MAAIPVTFSGLLFDKKNKTQQNVTFIGLASITGLGIGGGPILPPDVPPDQIPPDLGFWQDPGGYNPDNPNQPWPPETEPPPDQKPPFEVKVGWTEENGWFVVLVPTGTHPAPSGARKR